MSLVKNVKMIEVSDWDDLVSKTYGRPYSFQQQDGCKGRGTFNLTVPSDYTEDEEMNDEIPEVINGTTMGVKFDKWLGRDPKLQVGTETQEWSSRLFWVRNFYPDVNTVVNDLHKKGLIEAGSYIINIDW